jgi:hypothetical protein
LHFIEVIVADFDKVPVVVALTSTVINHIEHIMEATTTTSEGTFEGTFEASSIAIGD